MQDFGCCFECAAESGQRLGIGPMPKPRANFHQLCIDNDKQSISHYFWITPAALKTFLLTLPPGNNDEYSARCCSFVEQQQMITEL